MSHSCACPPAQKFAVVTWGRARLGHLDSLGRAKVVGGGGDLRAAEAAAFAGALVGQNLPQRQHRRRIFAGSPLHSRSVRQPLYLSFTPAAQPAGCSCETCSPCDIGMQARPHISAGMAPDNHTEFWSCRYTKRRDWKGLMASGSPGACLQDGCCGVLVTGFWGRWQDSAIGIPLLQAVPHQLSDLQHPARQEPGCRSKQCR